MYRITRVLSVGPFASPERAERLLAAGVTHVLNVCDGPCVVSAGPGSFRQVAWVPMQDSVPLRPTTAIEVLDTLHGMVCDPDSRVYVHCMAGHLRSPTVLWLYLIACGLSPDDARDRIETASPVATAGYPLMVTPAHVLLAQRHGLANFFPHPRGEVLLPFDTPE